MKANSNLNPVFGGDLKYFLQFDRVEFCGFKIYTAYVVEVFRKNVS
ncbi:hypothetical protein [Leptospira weilii]|nr:hypothetical protein [Leptospira weilii]UPY79762.1 hypothetical protein FH581_016310 [Leptospira weilii]